MTRHLLIILIVVQLGMALASPGLHINLHPAPVLHTPLVQPVVVPVHSAHVITPVHARVITPVHAVHAVHGAPVVKYKVKNHYHVFGK